MINCTLTPDQIRVFRVKIAGDLLDIINDLQGSFTLDSYIKGIYAAVEKATSNKNLATEYAKIAPIMIAQLMIKPDVISIRKKGLSGDKVLDLIEEFSDPEKGLDATVKYLGLNEPEQDIDEIISEINLNEQREQLKGQISKTGSVFVRPRPVNPFATTINTLLDPENPSAGEDPVLAYYTDFLKMLVAKGIAIDEGKTGIDYPGVDGGIHLALVSIDRIPEGQRYSQPVNRNPYAFVITDAKGNLLYFNENYEVSNTGRVIYYGSRPIPTKLDTGKYDWSKNKYTQSPQEISDNSEGAISVAQAEKLLTNQFNGLEKSYAYLDQNPGNSIIYSITGASLGVNVESGTRRLKVKDADFGKAPLSLYRDDTDKKSPAKIKVGASEKSVAVYTKGISTGDVEKLVKLLTEDIFVKRGKKRVALSQQDKYTLLNSFLGGQSKKGLTIEYDYDVNELIIKHEGKEILLDEAGSKEKLTEAFSKNKKYTREYTILHEAFNNNIFKNFNLVETDGVTTIEYFTENQIDYLDRVSKEISGNFDSNGKLAEYNGYFTVAPVKAEIGKIVLKNPAPTPVTTPTETPVSTDAKADIEKKSNLVNEAAAEQAIQKSKAVRPSVGRSSADSSVIGNAIKSGKLDNLIGKAKKLNKLDKQQSVKATIAQIYAAKAWYESSPLAKVVPYEVMFNAVNSNNRNAIAEWTRAGITLFKGSDFSDLYHEAWHAFTQTFMTEAQRNEMYAEVRKSTGTFMSYMGRTVSFADATLLELEEYLAEDFREFMLGKGKKIKDKPVRNKFFQFILDLFNKLFGGTTTDEVQMSPRDNKVLNELYQKLRVGNLTGYTFNQANANFDVLNKSKTIESTNPDSPFVMNTMISKVLLESTDALFSEYIDAVNAAYGLSSATTTLIKDKDGLATGYAYVQEQMITQLEYLVEQRQKLDSATEDTSDLDFAIETLAAGLANFGDPYNLDNPVGLVKFHKNNSPLMKSTIENIEEEASVTDRNVFEKKAGNEVPLANLARPDVLFAVGSLKAYEKDGTVKTNILGLPLLNDFKKSWNRILNITEGANTDMDVYEKLKEAQDDYPIVKEFLSKIGSPQNQEEASVNLWTDLTKILTMPRINLRMLEIKQADRFEEDRATGSRKYTKNFVLTPVEATGEFRKIGRKWNDNFSITDENEFMSKDIYGNNYLNINAVYRQFRSAKFTKDNIDDIYKFFASIGITLEDSKSAKANAFKAGLVDYAKNTLSYLQAMYAYNNSEKGKLNPIMIYSVSDIFKPYRYDPNYKLPDKVENIEVKKKLGGGSGVYNGLQKFQLKWSDDFADTTVNNANNQSQQERSLRSTISNQISKWNKAKNITELTQAGVENANDLSMSHLNPARNPFVKTTIIYKSTFDKDGNRLSYRDSSTKNDVPVSIQLNNMAGFMNQYTNVRNIMERSGIDASSADETTKLVGDFLMLTLYGATEATRHADKATTLLYKLLNGKLHYIDLKQFKSTTGQVFFADTLIGYISSEYERIQKLKNGDSAGTVTVGKSTYAQEASQFKIFGSIIENANELLETMEKAGVQTSEQFLQYLNNDPVLLSKLQEDVINYLVKQREKNTKMLQDTGILDNKAIVDQLLEKLVTGTEEQSPKQIISNLTEKQRERMVTALIDGYTANDWIHKYEFSVMFYGDPALYKDVDDFFKRNAGIAATGDFARVSPAMTNYINNKFAEISYAATRGKSRLSFGNTMNSAVMQDVESTSIYYDTYLKAALKVEKDRLKKVKASKEVIAKAEASIRKVFSKYQQMTEADGQGWISFDAYRALLMSMNKWTPNQEFLYTKIVKGESVSADDVLNFFPVKKMQYWGPLKGDGLPVMAFHKYSLMPLIPTLIKNTPLERLHNKMVDQDIDYALMQSGSKLNTVTTDGTVDKFYNDNQRKVEGYAFDAPEYNFTKNTIFLDYFKDQLEVADYYKKKNTFSSQLRKLIEQGLFENTVPVDFKPELTDKTKRLEEWKKVSDPLSTKFSRLGARFEQILDDLVAIEKRKIKEQVGSSKKNLVEFIKNELTGEGKKLSEHEVDFIGVDEKTDKLLRDLDLSPSADVIERALVGIAQKRILNQKITGESLVQVSGVGFEQGKLRSATESEIARYGTNGLAFYDAKLDSKGNVVSVSAMKIKISLQGPFKNLLNNKDVVDYSNKNGVTRLEALNALIKDELWLNQGNNRAMITTAAVRIPVQGLNSMEIMEVFEFLPEESGNIIILPAEMVAKSGGDFDIDKMFTFFPTIKTTRRFNKQAYKDLSEAAGFTVGPKTVKRLEELQEAAEEFDLDILTEEDKELIRLIEDYDLTLTDTNLPVNDTKTGLENQLLEVMKEILLDPFNFSSLVTPNSTDIMEPLGEDMARQIPELKGEGKTPLAEIFEVGRNLYKHQSNNVGKDVLGIIAVVNTFQSIFGRSGLIMEKDRVITTVTLNGQTVPVYHPQRLQFRHNKVGDSISLSAIYDAEQLNKISDIISQLINGSVDVAKKAWIFNVQGNKELINNLLFMVMAGVPVEDAVYFLSQPIIRDYVKEQRKFKSEFSRAIGYGDVGNFFRTEARNKILFGTDTGTDKYGFDWRVADFVEKKAKTTSETDTGKKKLRPSKRLLFESIGALAGKHEFSKNELSTRLNKKEDFDDYDRAVFLHFLEISEMSSQITQLTQNLNFDRTKTETLLDARLRLGKIDELTNGVSEESIRNIIENSPVAAYKLQDFILELFSELFPLRDNSAVNRYIAYLTTKNETGLPPISASKKMTGLDSDEYIERFRSDLVNYAFQSNYFNFDGNVSAYRGFDVEALVSLEAGARVKDGKLYVSRNDISTAFQQGLYSKQSMWAYGVAPVSTSVFDLYDKQTAEALYTKFVYEREVLRSYESNSPEALKTSTIYKRYLESFKDDAQKELKAYESTLRDMALDNLNYHGHVFFGGRSYAKQVMELSMIHSGLADEFSVLDRFEIVVGGTSFITNDGQEKTITTNTLKFTGDRPTPEELDIYAEEIQRLADPNVKKVDDAQENERISKLFSRYAVYALLQSGIDTTSAFSLIRSVPNDAFYSLVKEPYDQIIESLKNDPFEVLNKYTLLFNNQYKIENKSISNKIKNYAFNPELIVNNTVRFTNDELDTVESNEEGEVITPNRVLELNGIQLNLDALEIPFTPNDQQMEALQKIADFIDSDEDIFTLMGYAGTGKSSITKIALEYMRQRGLEINVTAPTHKAKKVIAKLANTQAVTLQKLLGLGSETKLTKTDLRNIKLTRGSKIAASRPDIVIVDEASLVGDDLFNDLKDFAKETESKILFIGDPAQLNPVEGDKTVSNQSKAFDHDNKYELTKVERQSGSNPLGAILETIRNNQKSDTTNVDNKTQLVGNQGIVSTNGGVAFRKAAADAFLSENFEKNRNFARILSYSNERVEAFNNVIRKVMGYDEEYVVGDILMAYDNVGYNRGEYEINNSVDYKVVSSKFVEKSFKELGGLQLPGYEIEMEEIDGNGKIIKKFVLAKTISPELLKLLAEGLVEYQKAIDRDVEAGIIRANQAFPIYSNFKDSIMSTVDVKDNKGRVILKKSLDYGYAHTIHKSQGSTYTNVFVDSESIIDAPVSLEEKNQLKYVALSRATNIVYSLNRYGEPTTSEINWNGDFGSKKTIVGNVAKATNKKRVGGITTETEFELQKDTSTGVITFGLIPKKEDKKTEFDNLTEGMVRALSNDYPNTVFVRNEASVLSRDTVGTNVVYRAMGDMSLGIRTKTSPRVTQYNKPKDFNKKAAWTDATLVENKKMIDEDIAALVEKRESGVNLAFDVNGYGQYLIGYNEYFPAAAEAQFPDNASLGVQTFLYLSQQLFEKFGYVNPHYLSFPEGRVVVQYGAPVTDEQIAEFNNKCFK
jgi:exodeoxyribonuclease-5